jgi:DNA-binding NtrC family response regulator
MTPNPAVLLGLRPDAGIEDRLEGWVRRLGYQARCTTDAREIRSWLGREEFAASFVDSDLGSDEGVAVWRTLRPSAARRTVLLVRDRGRDLWFEALRSGVATVLPLPLQEVMVRAALVAVARRGGASGGAASYR